MTWITLKIPETPHVHCILYSFNDIDVDNAGSYEIYIRNGAVGSGTFKDVKVTNSKGEELKNEAPQTYSIRN